MIESLTREQVEERAERDMQRKLRCMARELLAMPASAARNRWARLAAVWSPALMHSLRSHVERERREQ